MDLLTTDACTLPTPQRPLRLAEFEELFAAHLTGSAWTGDLLRLTLHGEADLLARVADLVARESACCSFFEFDLRGTDADVVLVVGVPPSRRAILDGLATMAAGALR